MIIILINIFLLFIVFVLWEVLWGLLDMVIHQLIDKLLTTKDFQSQCKEEILFKWEESKKYPRKKKNRVRKELLLDWSLSTYDLFEL